MLFLSLSLSLGLTSVSMIISEFISMLLQVALFCSLLWLSNTPLYKCTTSSFMHSSVDGHLGCFHVLVFVSSAAVNIGVHVSFRIMVVSRYMPQRKQWHPTPVFLPRKSHRWRSLVGCSPWGREESGMTELLTLLGTKIPHAMWYSQKKKIKKRVGE